MLETDGTNLDDNSKDNFLQFHSNITKIHNFFFTYLFFIIFCPKLTKETTSISNSTHNIAGNLHLLQILSFQKTYSILKWYLNNWVATKTTWYISKSIIVHLHNVKYNFGAKSCSNCSKAVFMKRFHFFLPKADQVSMHF